MVAKYAIEHWTRIPVEVALAHEFRYCDPIVNERTLVVSISQSGETMDTLMAVKHARELGALTVSVCNTHGSTIPRESDAVLYTHAGPEIAVASTKAFLAQITACYVLGLYLAQLRGGSFADDAQSVMKELGGVPAKIETLLGQMGRVKEIAGFMADTRVGPLPRPPRRLPDRHGGRAQAQGARLHPRRGLRRRRAQARPDRAHRARPAGLRRRAVADERARPARQGRAATSRRSAPAAPAPSSSPRRATRPSCPFADEVIRVPATSPLLAPLLTVVPLQVFALWLSTAKGLDVDQPRNLAKSVTVE